MNCLIANTEKWGKNNFEIIDRRVKKIIRTLVKFRGMESGLKYSEAFELIRSTSDF